MKKKAVSRSLLLCLIMGILSASMPVFALTQSGVCGAQGENLTWRLEDGTLTINGTGEMKNYNGGSQSPWYAYRSLIQSVVIREGVTSVGNYAFYMDSALKSVSLGKDVKRIGMDAFRDCGELAELCCPQELERIEGWAFYGCGLRKAAISGNAASVGKYAFSSCKELTSVTLGEGVLCLEDDAFSNCGSLTEISLPNSLIRVGSSVFYGCNAITDITYNGSISAYYQIDGNYNRIFPQNAILRCKDGAIKASGLCGAKETSSLLWRLDENGTLTICGVGEMGSSVPWRAYRDDIKNVVVESGVTRLASGAFNGCERLTGVTLPESLKEIGYSTFQNCIRLTYIRIPDSVTSILFDAFCGCVSLAEISVPDGVTEIDSNTFCDCRGLTRVRLGIGVKDIGWSAFSGCDSLTEVIYAGSRDSFESITIGSDNEPFTGATLRCEGESLVAKGYCGSPSYSLSWELDAAGKLTIADNRYGGNMADYSEDSPAPWYDYRDVIRTVEIKEPVSYIGAFAFFGCGAVTDVTLPENIRTIGEGAFSGCVSLKNIQIPAQITRLGAYAFYNCSRLKTVLLPEKLESIGDYAFAGCAGMEDVFLSSTVTNVGSNAFSGCSKLLSVTLGERVVRIGDRAFSGCRRLEEIFYFGDQELFDAISLGRDNASFQNAVVHFSEGTLRACGSCGAEGERLLWQLGSDGTLTVRGTGKKPQTYPYGSYAPWYAYRAEIQSVILPEGLTEIGGNAFAGCRAMTELAVPLSVTHVDSDAFAGCICLQRVYYSGGREEWSEITIDDGNQPLLSARRRHHAKFPGDWAFSLSGTVTSSGDGDAPVTVQLLSVESVLETVTVTDGRYAFDEVEPGDYTLRVSKTKHCPRDYQVTIGEEDAVQDVVIWLYGDVNGDGSINNLDALQISRKTANSASIFDGVEDSDYRFRVANVTALQGGDNVLNNLDVLQINRRIANLDSVLDMAE